MDPQAHPRLGRGVPGHLRASPPQRHGHRVGPGDDPDGGWQHLPRRGRVRSVLVSEEQEVGERLRRCDRWWFSGSGMVVVMTMVMMMMASLRSVVLAGRRREIDECCVLASWC